MDLDSNWDEDFVLELPEEDDDCVDENDNYKHEPTNTQQSTDPTPQPPKLDAGKEIYDENFFADHEPYITQSHNKGQRQAKLSEYFSVPLPADTPVKRANGDSSNKMVKVSLLLNQLGKARVVVERLPANIIAKYQPKTSKTIVQRYCYKCKTLKVDRTSVTMCKNCSKCGTALLYICDKCNENHYHEHYCLTRHRLKCTGEKTGKSLDDIRMLYCAQCNYKTSYEDRMKYHEKNSGHKVLGDDKVIVRKSVQPNRSIMSECIVKLRDIDYGKAKKRYCPNCKKVAESNSSRNYDTCDTCQTILLFKCTKCDRQFSIYRSIIWHLKTKCYSSVYRCKKCKYTAPSWPCMRQHLNKSSHAKLCSKNQNVKKELRCEHCVFVTYYKHNLLRHLQKFHEEGI